MHRSTISRTMILVLILGCAMVSGVCAQSKTRKKPAHASTAAPASARGDSPEQELVLIEKELFDAIRHKDIPRLETLLAEKFTYVQPGKPDKDRATFLKDVKAVQGEVEWLGANELKIHIYGDVAVVSGVQNAKVRMKDNSLAEGDTAFVDIFRREGGSWALALVQAVELPKGVPEGAGQNDPKNFSDPAGETR